MSHRFDIITVHPGTLLDGAEIEAITGGYLAALGELGGRPRPAVAPPDRERPCFLLVATGGSEGTILEWWDRHRSTSPDEELWLISHPGNNSLPAALEVLARLQQDGMPGRIFFLRGPDDEPGLQRISDAVRDVEVRRALRRARIGLVGEPSDWLVASMPDAATVRSVWGPTVVPVTMAELVAAVGAVAEAELDAHVEGLVSDAVEVREATSAELRDVARVSLALRRIVADHDLDALTLRCFDLVLDHKTTGCFGLAQLTDDGVIAGCEGDLVSTVGLLWARMLLDRTPWMANPARLDPDDNSLCLAHCTVPRSLVHSYRLRSHFESGLGVGIQGMLPAGPVTLLRIGGKGMDRVWLAEGEILASGRAENLCRTQAEIRLSGGGTVADLLRAPLGNHIVMVFGHHLERLRSWCTGAAIRVMAFESP